MKEEQSLLPCPFCGGEAKDICEYGSWGYYPARHRVKCIVCGIGTESCDYEHVLYKGEIVPVKNSGKNKAIKLWNTRTPIVQKTGLKCKRSRKAQQ